MLDVLRFLLGLVKVPGTGVSAGQFWSLVPDGWKFDKRGEPDSVQVLHVNTLDSFVQAVRSMGEPKLVLCSECSITAVYPSNGYVLDHPEVVLKVGSFCMTRLESGLLGNAKTAAGLISDLTDLMHAGVSRVDGDLQSLITTLQRFSESYSKNSSVDIDCDGNVVSTSTTGKFQTTHKLPAVFDLRVPVMDRLEGGVPEVQVRLRLRMILDGDSFSFHVSFADMTLRGWHAVVADTLSGFLCKVAPELLSVTRCGELGIERSLYDYGVVRLPGMGSPPLAPPAAAAFGAGPARGPSMGDA